jgi:hypothetical protein
MYMCTYQTTNPRENHLLLLAYVCICVRIILRILVKPFAIACIRMYICYYLHMYVHLLLLAYVCTCVRYRHTRNCLENHLLLLAYVCTFNYVCKHNHMLHIHACRHAYMHVRIQMRVDTSNHICMYVCMYAYKCMYTQVIMCVRGTWRENI